MIRQLSLAEAVADRRLGTNAKLTAIDRLIDWRPLEREAKRVRPGQTGRPPYEALKMLKALYLGALYDLSDPALEEALTDRLSFRRFCGFALDEATPDATTLLRFRQDATAVLEACFALIARQLEVKGLILRKGTLMDASLIAARHNRPPASAGLGARHAKEPEADWTKKNGKAHFGYKLSVGADEGSLLVRRFVLSSAKLYESEVADGLISWDERAVYGDKAYPQRERRAKLQAAGIIDRIMHRRHKHQPALPRWQQRHNQLIARRRAPVEAVFSALKRLYGRGRARTASLARNIGDFAAVLTAYNLSRAVRLLARQQERCA